MEALSLVNKLHILCRVNDAPLSRFNDPPGPLSAVKVQLIKSKYMNKAVCIMLGHVSLSVLCSITTCNNI